MGIAGSIESVTLSGREFAVAADAEGQRKLGGFENEVQPNGNGTTRTIKTRVAWSIDGLMLNVDDARGDHEFLQDLADGGSDFPFAITYPSGDVYQGTGQITGEMQASTQNATAAVNFSGPGKLEKQ